MLLIHKASSPSEQPVLGSAYWGADPLGAAKTIFDTIVQRLREVTVRPTAGAGERQRWDALMASCRHHADAQTPHDGAKHAASFPICHSARSPGAWTLRVRLGYGTDKFEITPTKPGTDEDANAIYAIYAT